jgi:hypothetical protein
MVWAEYIHHVTLHFPIVLSIVLAAVGIWWVRTDDARLGVFLRFAGWAAFGLATLAMVSGIIAAPGLLGGDGPPELSDHRYMGIVVWVASGIAATAFELGRREENAYVQRFGALCWCAVAFAAIGAGHWGGSTLHSDSVPWDRTQPAMETWEASQERELP